MAALKVLRLLATLGLAMIALIHLSAGNWFSALALLAAASSMWLVPRILAGPRKIRKLKGDFQPAIAHDNIAIDTDRNILWIRDPKLGERYVRHGELLSFRTSFDSNNGTFRQRIEIQLRDVTNPQWHVLFERHSDTWIKASQKNGHERDEWFARLQAWDQAGPASRTAQSSSSTDLNLPSLHAQYYQVGTDEARHNYLVAFDIGCDTDNLDQKAEWERLGGEYPGPSAELLKFSGAPSRS